MFKIFALTIILASFNTTSSMFFEPNGLLAIPTSFKKYCANPISVADQRLACQGSDEVLKIHGAIFGQIDTDLCPPVGNQSAATSTVCDESFTTKSVIKDLCENKQSCVINILANRIPIACSFHNTSSSKSQGGQYLEIEYRCNGNRLKFHPFAGNSRTGKFGQKRLPLKK